MKTTLIIGKQRLMIIQLAPNTLIPKMDELQPFWSITKTEDEISIVLLEQDLDPALKAERGWRYLKVKGPLDFSLTGILSSIATPLAKAGISIFVISTFDTDFILLKEASLELAITVLRSSGFHVTNTEII